MAASGIRPGGGSAMDAFADPSPAAVENRLVGAIVRAAERELGLVIASPDARTIDYRQAAFLAAAVSK